MSGGGSTTVEKADPWEPQQEYLKEIFEQARQLYQRGGPQYYPGQQVASINPAEQQSLAHLMLGGQQAAQAAKMSQGALQTQLQAADVNNNPYFQKALEAALRPLRNEFLDAGGVMSAIRTSSQQNSGGYGRSSRQGIAEGLAAGRFADAAGDVAARMASDAYGQGLTAAGRALALAPTVQGMQMLPAQMYGAAGDFNRQYEQALIDAEMNKWNYEQNLPWLLLSDYRNLIQGMYGGTSTARATGGGSKLGGALTGASLGGMAGGMIEGATAGSTLGLPGMAIGAVLGLLLS